MKSIQKIILLFLLALSFPIAQAQELYVKTFGKPQDKPILFLHGGPGYNSAGFEISTAQKLADQGFFVIVYDRRGEGRSVDTNARFNFEQTFSDINSIRTKYDLNQLNLMGHSFGGIVAILYAQQFPQNVGSVLLVSAPVALQESFATIQNASRKLYESKNDQVNLKYLDMLAAMDHSSMEYASYSFMHAMQNGFYTPRKPNDEAKLIYQQMAPNPNYKYVTAMTREAPMGFWKNEKYTTLDLTQNIRSLVSNKIKIFGIYGVEDGLYSVEQVEKLGQLIGKANLIYVENAAHNVFIDQQQTFWVSVKQYLQ
ncbi:alpha/beta hydrolase [Flavobacterium sp.]|uniref:alpha/beta hydrolase n=1 Tax=Flavobacterium sp. TaxID=239 RepID=UPI0039E6C287